MKRTLVSLTSAAFAVICTSAQATLLMYEPFDYPAGERLGGSTATVPVGKTNANGQVWITRSPVDVTIPYDEARDVLVTSGSMSYPGLAPSMGNSVRYGTNAAVAAKSNTMYTVAIDLPGNAITSGSVYYSMIVHFHSAIPGGVRTSYASFSEETADLATDAGYGLSTSSGTTGIPLPASAWIRNHSTISGLYQLGAGKQNGDGNGTSSSLPAWQYATAYPNQQGNTSGAGQEWATIETDTNQPYFIVIKYEFQDPDINDDKVAIWVNPAAATLGRDDGEWDAGVDGGSYYSATNSTVGGNFDAYRAGILSFLLIGNAQASTALNKSIDVSVDELRIGTTWADVTPVAPVSPQIFRIDGAGTTSVTVTWTNVQVGTNYVLQYNTNLSTANWTDLAPVTAAGDTASQTDTPPSGDAVRFYRVLKQ